MRCTENNGKQGGSGNGDGDCACTHLRVRVYCYASLNAMCILACLHVRMYLRACVMYSRASMHQQLFFHKHLVGSLPLAHRHFLFLAPLSHTYMQPSPLFSREDAQVIDSRL